MSVFIETSLGDIVVDLFVDDCPKACKNFLKLCKIKYYHNCIFHTVQRGFIAQTGDPTNTGKGGSSVYGLLYGEQARLFESEVHPHLRHAKKGMVAMASGRPDQNASQFYITTGTDLHGLDDKHTIFGVVEEGLDVLDTIDRVIVDKDNRPLRNIRIRRTEILDDPYDDPPGLESLLRDSPEPQFEFGDRLEEDWQPTNDSRSAEEIEADIEKQKAANRKIVLEMIGDRPEADAKPPEDMIFVCKLNPVTTEADLETIFCRFGTITSCDIVRDKKTGDSLNYAFIGFDSKEAAEEAYLKMNNALVDDRRIKVDFSQSMFHLWKQFRRFGKQGDAADKRAAEEHGGAGPSGGRILDGGRFELTSGNQHGYGTGKYSFVHDDGRPGPESRSRGGGKRPRSPEQQRKYEDRPRRRERDDERGADVPADARDHHRGEYRDRKRDERHERSRDEQPRERSRDDGGRDRATEGRRSRDDERDRGERKSAKLGHQNGSIDNGGERNGRDDLHKQDKSAKEHKHRKEHKKEDKSAKEHKHRKEHKKEKRSKEDRHRHRSPS